jgi:hypothetical protein
MMQQYQQDGKTLPDFKGIMKIRKIDHLADAVDKKEKKKKNSLLCGCIIS